MHLKIEQFKYLWILICAQRGGIGKSFATQLLHSMLMMLGLRITVLDADVGNSSTLTLYPDARSVDLQSPTARGYIVRAINELKERVADAALMDVGAGKQQLVMELLPRVSTLAKAAGVRIVWVHPVTSCNFVQTEAVRAVDIAKQHGIGLVWARQLGQGHEKDDYHYWEKTSARAAGLAYAVECEVPNASRFLVDNAASLGLSLADVAFGNFEKLAPDDRAIAEQLFSADVRCFAADYMAEVTETLGVAVTEALSRAAAHQKSGADQ
ncbi:hypothetical protein GJ654_12410 [Rhodoblastus acidophilus]|uniref:CobQ/CobB/MinD/ParA nucleotide binding domain-containing protein n=1 Tax=Rhodoblastus acidophilus TaxID=1074 RepID=A0A6N8DMU2_RHOAC|nr:hypothetical protein [Rhodoblastus acidophilus]MCW2275319.1 MinD-like ATPase involved in chromosome partitioning or flagellar assembly [Rhodoblastus acidophilus]MTV31789.1 hypothetical protein [Rhodoblastus acidophilus]